MNDIILNNGDLNIQDGDFKIDDSLLQEAELILTSAPGHCKQFPAIGVDLESYINNESNFNDLKREFKQHCKYDSKKVKEFKIENGQINIDVE